MKTSSSKILPASKVKYYVGNYSVSELKAGEEEAQKLVDEMYEKKKQLSVEQNFKSKGFKVDNKVKESYPDPGVEVELFEERVQEEVEKRLKKIEEKAYEDGFEDAKESGYKAGLKVVKEKVEPFSEEMKQMAVNFRKIREELVIKNEEVILRTMIAIIEKVIMSDYQGNHKILREMISSVIKNTGEREDIEIRLSKYDYERMSKFSKDLVEELGLKNGLRLEIDPGIDKGGCKVITNLGVIDATLDQQFSKLKKELPARVQKPRSNLVEEKKIAEKKPVKGSGSQQATLKKSKNVPSAPSNMNKNVKAEDVVKIIKNRIKSDD